MYIDIRESYCYQEFRYGRCAEPRPINLTKALCCCSEAAGWGDIDQCELCPRPGEGQSLGQLSLPSLGAGWDDIDSCELCLRPGEGQSLGQLSLPFLWAEIFKAHLPARIGRIEFWSGRVLAGQDLSLN